MPALRFGIYTTIGCIPWTTALAVAGYAVGTNWESIVNAFHGPDLHHRGRRGGRPGVWPGTMSGAAGPMRGSGRTAAAHGSDRDGERTRGAHRPTGNGADLSGR